MKNEWTGIAILLAVIFLFGGSCNGAGCGEPVAVTIARFIK